MINVNNLLTFFRSDSKRKYYVYRLLDPRNYQTFYVGKGCGDRVFQHVKNVRELVKALESTDEDAISLKEKLILEIIASGKEVITIIHRYGLTEKEAYEVEAALIDAYSGLTNIQRGHDYDRGVIAIEDLNNVLDTPVYNEPEDKYIIIKTTPNVINNEGSLYEATRKAWRADLKRAKKYKYVLSVVYGIVLEIYKVDNWYTCPSGRIAFNGSPTNDPISSLKNKRIPEKYRKKGAAFPFLYKK